LWGISGTSLKNGVFLTVPACHNFANAAKTPHTATFSRLRSSSDFSRLRLLRAAKFWQAGAVRNIIVFSYGAGNTPQPSGRRKTGPRRPNEREGTGADAVLLALANR